MAELWVLGYGVHSETLPFSIFREFQKLLKPGNMNFDCLKNYRNLVVNKIENRTETN